MIVFVAVLLVLACIAASGRRLRLVMSLPALDATTLGDRIGGADSGISSMALAELEAALATRSDTEWELSLLSALTAPAEARPALVGEAMTELDFVARAWARVPRVAASLASSFGFLLATLQLRVALSTATGTEGDGAQVTDALLAAVDVVAVGLAGAAACAAIHKVARSLLAKRLAAAHRLVDVLEAAAEGGPLVEPGPRASVASRQTVEQVSSG